MGTGGKDFAENGNPDIYGYNLNTGEERPICTEEHTQSSPDISGDWVVWIDGRRGGADIYACNLATDEERAVCTEEHLQFDPAISGDWVVWEDHRNSVKDSDIYALRLTELEEGE